MIVVILHEMILSAKYRAPRIDMSELETLFSAATPAPQGKKPGQKSANVQKPEKVQLVCYHP